MTFKERLTIEHPDLVSNKYDCGCPCTYGYEPDDIHCPEGSNCTECWNREMPPTSFFWVPCIDEHARMPEEGEEVLCTLKEDWSYGKGTDVQYHVFESVYKTYKEDCYDMPSANGKGYFESCNDWDEGQPLSVIAWMPKPKAYKE